MFVGIDLIGIWFGPFPTILCDFINITKASFTATYIFTLFNIFVLNFMFVCVWKKMRMMIDLLLFHLISRLSVMLAIGLSIMKSMAPGKPTLNVVSTFIFEYRRSCQRKLIVQNIIEKYHLSQTICCRTYNSSMDNLGQKWSNQPVEVLITSFLFLVYLILLVPIYIKRRQNEQQDQPNLNQLPKSLESLLMNFGIIMVCILVWILLYIMNRYEFKII